MYVSQELVLPEGVTLRVANGIHFVRVRTGGKVKQRIFKTAAGADRFIASVEEARLLRTTPP